MGIYYTDLIAVLEAAGVRCGVNSINSGWESRARSSGGFPSAPKGIVWHHTASKTSVESDLSWMIDNCDDAPVGNMLIDREGVVWPIAAGASNCAGKGGPAQFSRGQVAQDSGNTGCWNIEVANNGVGESWPQAQIDTYFRASNALNARFGNQPSDVITHNVWAPDRKIDPATANAVQGPWHPDSVTSSGTWDLNDIINECQIRAGGSTPPPTIPPPQENEDVSVLLAANNGSDEQQSAIFWWDGKAIGWVRSPTQIDVGRVCGLYTTTPLLNFTASEIQGMMEAGWAGGPIPPGYTSPVHPDSGVD